MFGVGLTEIIVIAFYISVIVVPVSKIVQKAGYSGWWSACAIIPLLNLVMLWVFAFSKWPYQQSEK